MTVPVAFAVAAIIGGVARWAVAASMNRSWPIGTLSVNITGAFAIGALHALTAGAATVMVVAGLGSFTSVSAVARECSVMVEAGRRLDAAAYVAVTFCAGVGACALGLAIS